MGGAAAAEPQVTLGFWGNTMWLAEVEEPRGELLDQGKAGVKMRTSVLSMQSLGCL